MIYHYSVMCEIKAKRCAFLFISKSNQMMIRSALGRLMSHPSALRCVANGARPTEQGAHFGYGLFDNGTTIITSRSSSIHFNEPAPSARMIALAARAGHKWALDSSSSEVKGYQPPACTVAALAKAARQFAIGCGRVPPLPLSASEYRRRSALVGALNITRHDDASCRN